MIYQLDAWNRFLEFRYFWLHFMLLIWLMFVFALLVIEPFFIKDHGRIVKDGHHFGNLRKTQTLHLIILILSLFIIFISVLGAYGFFS
jgi:hypothetical protein